MTEELKDLCPPCDPVVDFVPQEIPVLCPTKPIKDETNSHLYPTSKYIEVVEDCLLQMLTNMTNNKFCRVGPKCCDK